MATAEDRFPSRLHNKTPSTVGDLIAASNAPVPTKAASRSTRDDLSLFSFQGASPPPSNLTLRAHLLRAGFLQKQTSSSFNRTFVQRWFQLYCYPQRLEYLSEKNAVVTIQLDAGVELLDPPSDKPTEFTLRTLDRSWVLQAASEEECKHWQKDLQTVIDLAATYDTDHVEPVERAIEQLQEQLVYGHLKYNGKVFLRDIHGQAAGHALGRAKEKLREAEYLLGNKAETETFKIILSNYRSCLSLADELVQALWMRIHAQDLMEKFYNAVQSTENYLRKGESELNTAKAHWEVARSLLDQLRTTAEYRRNRGVVSSSTSEPSLVRVPSNSLSISNKDVEGSSPPPQKSPTATDGSTDKPQPVFSPQDTTGFIDDVQVMIDDITRRKLIENIETRISIALTRRRPSLAAGTISPLDRALITLQQLMRATGTMFKGTSFMTDKRLKPIKEKLEEFKSQLEEFKSTMGHDPSCKTAISRYEFAWLRLQQQMAGLQRRAEVHDFIEQINTLASRTGLSLAGRRQSQAVELWNRTKDLVARLRQIRDEEPLIEEKDIEDGLEEDAGVTINSPSSRVSTNLSRRGSASEKAALYMLDIDFFMVQWKKRAEEMESKFAAVSKELSQASDSDSANGLGK